MSVDTAENRRYLERLAAMPGKHAGDGMQSNFGEGSYLCVHAFAKAVQAAGSTDAEALVGALEQVRLRVPQGEVIMDRATHHAHVNTYLARCNADGTFAIIEPFGCLAPQIPERYCHLVAQAAARLAQHMGDPLSHAGNAQEILSLANLAILATDSMGVIIEANRHACLLFGYSGAELCAMSVHQLLPPHFRLRHAELLRQFVEGEAGERRMAPSRAVSGYHRDGTFFPLEASIAKVRTGNGWMLVVTMRDISLQEKAEQALLRQATHDSLEQVRPGDTVARLGGDEFVILCEQIEQEEVISAIAQRINHVLRRPCIINNVSLFVTASIGIATGHGSTHSPEDLLRSADTAMYAVKVEGRDGWKFFKQALQVEARQKLAITQGLRMAIERQELSPRFQPIVSADSGVIVGAELLLRWHPPGGEVSPALFIPIAEASGAIVDIGAWVFR
jgi:PAS domain S-box-containing protein